MVQSGDSIMDDTFLRDHLLRLLSWEDAHAGFDAAVDGIPAEARARRPEGLPHSPWQLVEHIRLAQRDILEFCTDPHYREREWPHDYWPAADTVPSETDWDTSLAGYRSDRDALRQLAAEADLAAPIPHGEGQTYLRELLLIADHTAYHVGQLVLVRRALGMWR
jgi:uncharacterized damage-inducible protein DinB